GKPRPIAPNGFRVITPSKPVSPDGRWVATADRAGNITIFSLDDAAAEPKRIVGVQGQVVRWSADGRTLYVRESTDTWGRSIRIHRVDPWTGRRELWKTLAPGEPIGSGAIQDFVMTADAQSYAYTYQRYFSDLFLVEGLR